MSTFKTFSGGMKMTPVYIRSEIILLCVSTVLLALQSLIINDNIFSGVLLYFSGFFSNFFLECKPGYHNDPNTKSVCRPCPINTYQPRRNMESCLPCPEGKMALNRGSTSCVPLLGISIIS